MAQTHLGVRQNGKESPHLTAVSVVATEKGILTAVSHNTPVPPKKGSPISALNKLHTPQLIFTFAFGGLARVRGGDLLE